MSSELSLVTVKPNRIVVQKKNRRSSSSNKRPSISTDLLFESLREERHSSNQRAAKDFIERTLGYKLSSNNLHDTLKDGVLLCSLMNRLQPGIIPQISRKDLPFVKMENISNFLSAARHFGLHTSDLFQTVDLFEGKHMERVVATILAIERVIDGKYFRRDSEISIEQKTLDRFKNMDIKESKNSDLIVREPEELNVNGNYTHIRRKSHGMVGKNNHRRNPTGSEKTLVDVMSGTSKSEDLPVQKKRPSLRKSVTMGDLYRDQKREELESEFAEDLAPLPNTPPQIKLEKPVNRTSSTRSNKKTHIRYKSDRTSEISINKEMTSDKLEIPIKYDKIHDFNKRRESVNGISSLGDLLKEKLILKDGDEITAQFQLGNCIGKGQFGSVYRALHLGTGQMVAVKRIKLEGKTSGEIEQLMQEVGLLRSLSHPSVVKYESFIMTNDHINIILEYVENGSLLHTLKSFGNFPEKLVASYVVKILEGLVYLHTKQVVHCDLKAANILTTKNGNVKLSDFGVSLNLKMMEQVSTEVAGTPNWMAPEVIELKGASTASDIWSLGCTIIELLTGKPPYSDLLAMTALFRIVEDDCPPLPENISDELCDFLKQCFHKKPSMRPTARDLFRHDWIKNNWSLKELRTQESLPFLRRITSGNRLSELDSSSNSVVENSSNNESRLEPESASKMPVSSPVGSPVGSPSILSSTKLYAATPMIPHRFVKNSFSKPVSCNICHSTVKKHAFMCEECNMICHTKCSPNAPFPCPLHNHTIRYIPITLIDDSLPKINNVGASSESDIPTITSPINSLSATLTPTTPKRKFVKKTKKEDSVNSQLSIADSVDSSASVMSSSNMADSSLVVNNGRFLVVDHSNDGNNNGGRKVKSKLKSNDDCAIM